ncbi:ABC transporter ATP-binding protein [Candidatus Cyanaurora vandensis]|uniref:ABC transporter ATP-binding protein n=1 Tax=Candidatus Cyanaurora vandensis TaxID=2714958 RepID=UPI00257D2A43|nr:ABC transporter ATP-binding protein [Candidatus Cyanaurora vandensis]
MSSFKDIVLYFKPYFRTTFFSVGAVSILEVLELAVPYATGQIVNVLADVPVDPVVASLTAIVGGNSLVVLLGAVALATVLTAPIQPWLGDWFHWDTAFRARRDHFNQAHRQILTLPLDYFDQNNAGRLAGRIIRGIDNHTFTFPDIAGIFLPKLVRILAIFGLMLWLDEGIALAFLLSFVLLCVYSFLAIRQLIKVDERLDEYFERTESRTSELITNIKTVRAFAKEEEEFTRQTNRADREFMVLDYRLHKGYVVLAMVRRICVALCVFGILSWSLWQVLQGQISVGHFITLLTITSIAYAEVSPLGEVVEIFGRRYASMSRFHEFLQEPVLTDGAVLAPQPRPEYRFQGKVQLQDLHFGYNVDRPVLKGINLTIQPRQTVALVGRSGSGKSTLVKLLLRYFEPNQGRILLDDQDIRELDVRGYRRRLAIVHQDVDLFNGTLWENLTYGKPTATPAEVDRACAMARVDEFLRLLPEGYQTVVGERGVRLSGGQKQRLGIARALLCDPDLLIFDEATSSLDYESERAIQLAMQNILGTCTTVIIAHRLSTVRDADVIVVFEEGEIVEMGNHSQLLAQGGIYARLHRLQSEDEHTDTDTLFAQQRH